MLNKEQILILGQIEGCGASTLQKFIEYCSTKYLSGIRNTEDLAEFVQHCIDDKVSPHSRIRHISIDDIRNATRKAEQIVSESEKFGISFVTIVDEEYPKCLLETIDENGKKSIPTLLYYKGDLSVTKKNGIAIIGTREPTNEGIVAGQYLGKKFAENGFNVVSGLAIGCDTAGHVGALSVEGGSTTAFLAHGLDVVYPAENENLAKQIVERGGLLMSEYPIGTKVNRYALVARDRLQAALSRATIVIQTGENGGTHHAANTTLKSGKPLFCVKYNSPTLMSNDKVRGNELLVKKGGRYITSTDALSKVSCSINQIDR